MCSYCDEQAAILIAQAPYITPTPPRSHRLVMTTFLIAASSNSDIRAAAIFTKDRHKLIPQFGYCLDMQEELINR